MFRLGHDPTHRYFRQDETDFYFELDLGTPILASCDGEIIDSLEDRKLIGREDRETLHSSNLVTLVDSTGLLLEYLHLYPEVKSGEKS